MLYALKRKGVDKGGAVLGLLIAVIISLASHAFFISLVVFFFSSSRATKFRGHLKRKIEKDYKEGTLNMILLKHVEIDVPNFLFTGEGQRNWIQVLCNGGMATQLAILYLLDCGSGEHPINFSEDYRSSWLGIAVLSMLSIPIKSIKKKKNKNE